MSILLDLAYAAAAPIAVPLLLRKSLKTGKYRSGLAERFGMGEELLPAAGAGARTLMLHCVSVGELNSVQTLIGRLLAADERLRIVVTTGTDTGTERGRKLFPAAGGQRVFAVRFPFDFSFAVERLLDRVRPDAIALVELETWPNFLQIAHDRGVPIAIVNGRISDRSFPRYRLIRPLMASMLKKVTWVGAQTQTIAKRFAALGAENVDVIPTLKYDNAAVADSVAGQEALADAMGMLPGEKLIVGGSIAPGEEIALLQSYLRALEVDPHVRLAIAPRHPEAVPEMLKSIMRHELKPLLRTEHPDSPRVQERPGMFSTLRSLGAKEVFVLNTFGELRKLYALAFVVFVGRSLNKKGGGGSDMIEVAALGKPCCFGPHTANFAEVAELLTRENAAVEVKDGVGLTRTISGWVAKPTEAAAMGARAQELIRGQQGSTDVYVQRILRTITSPGAAASSLSPPLRA